MLPGSGVISPPSPITPIGIVFLTNQYDANGRVTLQTQADSTTFQFAYTLDGTGRVTQTDVTA